MKISLFSIVTTLAFLVTSQLVMAQGSNVIVEVNNNGDMTVEGADNVDEFIYVEATTTPNQFVFFDPVGDTTFNGDVELTVNNIVGDMTFDLGSGENILILDDGPASDFEVLGELEIKSKGNLPTIIIVDDADIEGLTKITTKNGHDVVLMFETDVEAFSVNTGKGNDVVGAVGKTADFNANTVVTTGSGNDAVLLQEADFFGALIAKMGSGDDLAAIFDSNFLDEAVFNGNGGFDSFGQASSIFDLGFELKSIEDQNADPNVLSDQAFLNPILFQTIDLVIAFNLGL